MIHLADQSRILFQGDSITDGNRGRSEDPNHIMGHGYAFILAARYGASLAERNLTFLNRGISGNKVSDLSQRWQADTLELRPDVLSILIGINDLCAGISPENYQLGLDQVLARTIEALPTVQLILIEPFGLPSGRRREIWPGLAAPLREYQRIVAQLAKKHRAIFVPVQHAFESASARAPMEYWIWDGIHPTYNGHQLLADEWARICGL